MVEVLAPLPVPEVIAIEREVWKFGTADWDRLEALLQDEDWSGIQNAHPDEGARTLSDIVLQHASKCISKKSVQEQKSSHPWLNETVLLAVANKKDAEGTEMGAQSTIACSRIVKQEYDKWVAKVRGELVQIRTGSKTWWKLERQI